MAQLQEGTMNLPISVLGLDMAPKEVVLLLLLLFCLGLHGSLRYKTEQSELALITAEAGGGQEPTP